MGQYYTPIALKERANTPIIWWNSHRYGNGLKLMEHSYKGNNFVNVVENFLTDNPCRLVWAGDYADPEKDGRTLYEKANDYEDREGLDGDENNLPGGMVVINHTRKEYYRRDTLKPYFCKNFDGTKDEWIINPLPLLTCEGNERGLGDYRKKNGDTADLVGKWARNRIEVSATIPEGYREIFPYFSE